MVAASALALTGAAFAFAGGFALVRGRANGEGAAALAFDGRSRWVSRFRGGCAPLVPLARKLLAVRSVERAARDAGSALARRLAREGDRSDAPAELEAVLSWALAVAIVLGAATAVLAGSVVCGIAAASAALVALAQAARSDCEKHAEAVREEVPEALRSMGVCFRSGLSLLQTLKQVAHELDGQLGELFEVAARRLEMGATTSEALAVLRCARQVPELSFAAVALDAQHQSGGSIGAVLEAAQESVESELALRRSLHVQTAQAKLSARIVTLMPFLLVALFSLMSPGFLDPFFGSWMGLALLALALGMEVAGTAIVHRMLRAQAQ